MDPVTQGLLGATAAQLALGHKLGHRAWIAGLAGGLLPDADVVLEPLADPALPWSLHRHFTHALIMVPVMALLATLPLLLARSMRAAPKLVLGAAFIGTLTHGPLDWCTSYGTKILWPFSHHNWTIDLYPIVDPLFTLVLLTCVVLAARRRSRIPAVVATLFLALYTGIALHQRGSALEAQQAIARSRDHEPVRARVMPMPGSLLVWRSLYETDGTFHADGVRLVPFGARTWEPGGSARAATLEEGMRKKAPQTSPARLSDVWARFADFADGYVAWTRGDDQLLGDLRMSTSFGMDPIWGIRLSSGGIQWRMPGRERSDSIAALWSAIVGTAKGLRPLP